MLQPWVRVVRRDPLSQERRLHEDICERFIRHLQCHIPVFDDERANRMLLQFTNCCAVAITAGVDGQAPTFKNQNGEQVTIVSNSSNDYQAKPNGSIVWFYRLTNVRDTYLGKH